VIYARQKAEDRRIIDAMKQHGNTNILVTR
jgi:hypothetical protein